MPGAGFKTFNAGEVFTASDANTYLMQQAVMVFTNEAARDAAITSPSEGMHAYLTSPTIPAATGATTIVPGGITTVYNGSVWVCATEVCAYGIGTTSTTTSTTYVTTLTGDSTAVSVTLVTGTTALVSLGALWYATATNALFMTFSVSGATTISAATNENLGLRDEFADDVARTNNLSYVFSGLTAGTNTFTLNYRTNSSTANYVRRFLTVRGIV
jgi:hypothetical protein